MWKLIVAVDSQWGIGKNGDLLCHLSNDMKHFKETTMGSTVVMGRVTLESLPKKRGLPKRRNIVLTRNTEFSAERVETVNSVEELKKLLGNTDEEVFVMGGEEIYRQLLPYCDDCYVTKIDKNFGADRFFKNLDCDDDFEIREESERMEENGIGYRFVKYERK